MKFGHLAIWGAAAVALGAMTAPLERPVSAAAKHVTKAMTPTPPPAGLLVRFYRDMSENRLFAVAAGVAFYALLAIVPSMAAAVSLFGLFADPIQLASLPGSLAALLPAQAVSLVADEAQRLASQPVQSLSLKLGFAVMLSLWSASAAARACFDALNIIDEQQESRSIIRFYATSLAATLAGVVILSTAILVIGANPKFVALGVLSQQTVWLYSTLRWPLFFCVAVVVIMALYWVGPSRPPARFLSLAPGAAFAALVWALGSSAFGWYVANLGNYSATYGSLGTVAVVMTWLWLSAAIVLLGAQLNYELGRTRARTF